MAADKKNISFKAGGTYLVTGGLGGIGIIFAEYLIKDFNANLILVGRSPLNEKNQAKLNRIVSADSKVIYVQGDISIEEDVKKISRMVKEEFGIINGIIHSAGVIRDSFILKKKKEEINEVLAPKIFGTLNLYKVFEGEKLDFFALFSSISAEQGQMGQADYAYANSFMDSFAQSYQNVISINWSLWENGGMSMPQQVLERMKKNEGIIPIADNDGIEMFNKLLKTNESSAVALMKGNNIYLTETDDMGTQTGGNVLAGGQQNHVADINDKLVEKMDQYLKKIISDQTNISTADIDSSESLGTYGIDSIMILELTDRLEKEFGELSKTLFFENKTINELTKYFVRNYRDMLIQMYPADKTYKSTNSAPVKSEVFEDRINDSNNQFIVRTGLSKDETGGSEDHKQNSMDIAIIGIHGTFPMAENIHELWNNLKEGKDCITEIPSDRWDHDSIFDPDRSNKSKVYTKWGGFINDVDKFDPLFFKISPKEAEKMDPQERLFLQTVWHTMEDAGYIKTDLGKSKVGVFVGVMWGQYHFFGVEESMKGNITSVSSSFASIANRVSHVFDFHGPSIAIDTMCSSSLTAMHFACESIVRKDCEFAFVGGVNLALHPDKYISISQGEFAASDGRCRSFGEGGDGYVPGEGVGAVLLKPLEKAINDCDNIYSVIKGTAINHGGKTNGYTVPNPTAQEALILEAFKKADVSAESISYIETHGTGTALGDPIEISGLSNAFRKSTGKKQFCSIGSIKSNIGHLEAAAGIAGLVKVVLQMKYKQLVPSLHSKKRNSFINFEDTPFYVQQELSAWERPLKNDKEYYPRRAGISAFGAGGSNAHVIVEEFEKLENIVNLNEKPEEEKLFVLSAKSKDTLRDYAQIFIDFISRENKTGFDCNDFAYTLQIGREQLSERLAVIFKNEDELNNKLIKYCRNDFDVEGLFVGSCSQNKKNQNLMLYGGTSGKEFINTVLRNRELFKIAALWVEGIEFDWNILYQGSRKVKRMPLPGYPFLKERYWIERDTDKKHCAAYASYEKLHSLIDKNVSDLYEQKYLSKLYNGEALIKDHMINGSKYLPGAAYIEIARAAGEFAAKKSVKQIREITWRSPVVVENEKEVFVALTPNDSQVQFEVYSMVSGQKIAHAQGKLSFDELQDDALISQRINIEEIKKRCLENLTSDECYRAFEKQKIEYGPSFKTIKSLAYNEMEALSYLEINTGNKSEYKDCLLNPLLVDGALQSAIGLVKGGENQFLIPYQIEEINVMNEVKEHCFVYVERASHLTETNTFNIKILAPSGELLVNIKGFSLMVVDKSGFNDTVNKSESYETLCYKGVWEKAGSLKSSLASTLEGNILIIDTDDLLFNSINSHTANFNVKLSCLLLGEELNVNDHFFKVNSLKEEDYSYFVNSFNQKGLQFEKVIFNLGNTGQGKDSHIQVKEKLYPVFYLTKALMKSNINELKWMFVTVSKSSGGNYSPPRDISEIINAAVDGFNKTVRLERPNFLYKSLSVDNKLGMSEIVAAEMQVFDYNEVMYSNGVRYYRNVIQTSSQEICENKIIAKENGVYLISGGAGEIGLIFARYLAIAGNVRVVLCGRSLLDRDKAEKIKKIEKDTQSEILYVRADITCKSDVEKLVSEIKAKYNRIDGLIHSAGAIKDSFIINKREEEISGVLNTKILGACYLDEALKDEKLDFFILFSSVAAALGNVGQSDYAIANRFLDYFSEYRENMRSNSLRHGKTVSINWPLWENSGMTVDEKTKTYMKRNTGFNPIPTDKALNVFEKCMSMNNSHVVIAYGEQEKMKGTIERSVLCDEIIEEKTVSCHGPSTSVNNKYLKEKVTEFLRDIFANELKLPIDKIDKESSFDEYGIDSVIIMSINAELASHIKGLSKSLLYEFDTLNSLADYFIDNHGNWARKKFSLHSNLEKVMEKPTAYTQSEKAGDKATRFLKQAVIRDNDYNNDRDIAIVGISGKYPLADDLNTFWENLKEGRDCVCEIPEERWDGNKYYNPVKGEKGKTYSKWGGFVKGIDEFDASFFNISPNEAELMDPQERKFLELAWQALEDAGYKVNSLSDTSVGVFVGVMWGLYQMYGVEENLKGNVIYPGSSFASIANRVSYCLNLSGPSMAIDTMCSSSLSAVHLACESLRRKECDYALAGGVNFSTHPYKYLALCDSSFMSTDGKCRAFGAGGDGYVPGEGAGVVVLKHLKKALADDDNIYGIIKATSINHGGKTAGYTVPNPNAQATLIINAVKKSGIEPDTISYIEAHGTGTALGDPIEIAGLMNSIGKNFNGKSCAIGSVKSNIGHLEAAAGIAGITKVLMQMKHKQLVPSLHSTQLNENIHFDQIPFYVQQELAYWNNPLYRSNGYEKEFPRRACISSFGAGGSNAHIIIEEYESNGNVLTNEPVISQELFVLSAKNKNRLKKYAESLLSFVNERINDEKLKSNEEQNSALNLHNLAYTLQVGRNDMQERLAIIASSKSEFTEKLTRYCDGETGIDGVYQGSTKENKGKYKLLFDGDEDDILLKELVTNRSYKKLAHLWVSGITVDWTLLCKNSKPKRISVPTYPFESERYWIKTLNVDKTDIAPDTVLKQTRDFEPETASSSPTDIKLQPAENIGFKENLKAEILERLASLVKINKEDIDLEMEVNSIGFSSIYALRLLNGINQKYEIMVTPVDIGFSPILEIGQLVESIVGKIENTINKIGRTAKIALLENNYQDLKHQELFPEIIDMSSSLTIENIFLTGATGVLGGRLIKELLEMTESKIYCMVRAKNNTEAKERIKALLQVHDIERKLDFQFEQRVVPVLGNVENLNLGLNDATYNELTEKIDMVLHGAAKVSLTGVYDEVSATNVDGTAKLIDFTLKTKNKYFVFISTHVVMGDRWLKQCQPFTEKDLNLGQSFVNMGYQKSKFDAEVMTRLASKKGLKWVIVRSGNLMGDSEYGSYPFGLTNVTGMYYDLIKTAIEIKYAMDTPLYFDITPLDYISKSIVYLCTARKKIFETYHLTNPDYKQSVDVYSLIREYGYDFSIVINKEYMDIINNYSNGLNTNTSVMMELTRFNSLFSKTIDGSSYADNVYTTKILKEANIICPKIDSKLIKTYLDYCIKNGYLKKPDEY